ncbi:FkbM family methyltransferase [Cyanobacteria bacterium FACHB-63]|nr:FkbM family methyltransferase [Cyanobacteria bacterium FACHB-63]
MPIFLNALKQNGLLDRIHLSICNVGSRKVSAQDDYASQVWRVFAPNLTIYGFDADPEACEAANLEFEAREADWNEFHIPIALAKESGTATLYVTKNPMCSSLYRPHEELLQHFSGLPALVNLDHTTEVETTTLDTFCQVESIDEIDFLQIDVQGAELQVLEGAVQILNQSVLAIQAEVEFSPLYENQPLFADVDAFLRRQGFTLFDVSKAQIARSPIRSINRPGQLLWGDAIYLRDPFAENTPEQFKTPDQIFKLACIADALQFTDFALELLKTLTLKHGKDSKFDFANTILTVLNQMPELDQSPGAMALIAELETWRAVQS